MRKKLQETEKMKKKLKKKNRQSRVMMLSGDEGERIKEKKCFLRAFLNSARDPAA